MKQAITLLFVNLVLAASLATPAFAATTQATHPATAVLTRVEHGWGYRKQRWYGPRDRINNQRAKNCLINSGNKVYRGSNNGNSGNSRYNRGNNQDVSSNLGNQIVHRHGIGGHRRNNQYLLSCSIHSSNLTYIGSNNGNSGNSGYNRGVNQDASGNGANQIID